MKHPPNQLHIPPGKNSFCNNELCGCGHYLTSWSSADLSLLIMDTSTLSPELLAIHEQIVEKGNEIRKLKGEGIAKDALMPYINSLNELKEKYVS